jgi:hypothetical protein
MPFFDLDQARIPYDIIHRPRRRHPAIEVDRSGQLRVLLPAGVPDRDAAAILWAHANWVRRELSRPKSPSYRFAPGDRFWYRGELLTLELHPRGEDDPRSTISRRGDHLILARMQDAEAVRTAMVNWYEIAAAADLSARVLRLAPHVGRWPSGVRVREYRSRWGFCRADGLIAFNWRIVQAPPAVIDYVVVHELTHLLHPHHRPSFWEAVEAVTGDTSSGRQWLSENARALYW